MSDHHSTAPAASSKPAKPRQDFPLTAHPAGCWCKKIRGKLYYFGPWDDPDGAEAKYLAQKEDLYAGKTPRPDPATLTVKDVANLFLRGKAKSRDAGELSPRTWKDYFSIMEMMLDGLGKHRPASALAPQDFATLKHKLSKRNGPARMSTVVQVIRSAFKFAYDVERLDTPVRFGPTFKRTSKKTMRLHRAKQGAKLFTALEVRQMLDTSAPTMKAMILLGINAGFGNNDVATLTQEAIDWHKGIIDFPRPKTGIPRRCVLWPETIEAIQAALACRPTPKDNTDTRYVFITKYGQSWAKDTNAGPLTQETRKLLKRLGINGRRSFYTLRHTFRTVADEARDQPAADFAMGHESPHMSTHYREVISDDRLRAVAEHVRAWLFAKQPTN
jgi:integrase